MSCFIISKVGVITMSKKSILVALFLIAVGIVIGALIVSNTPQGIGLTLAAGEGKVKLGASAPPISGSADLKLSPNTFVAVAKAVTPTVVSITVTSSSM